MMLSASGICKTFFPGTVNERVALGGVDLHLDEGDFTTIIGSNGAGKSTLLNIVAGYMRPDAGVVTIQGRNVTRMSDNRRARYVGRVFQDPLAGTAPNLTIEQNLAIAHHRGKVRGLAMGVTERKRRFFKEQLAVLELGLEKRLKAKVGLLSGGQRQALSLLMATFTQPEILLLDEHTAALDPQRAALVTQLTKTMVRDHRLTTLMVTHNMAQALEVGNRLIMMHEGRIILDIHGEKKGTMSVPDLLAEFEKTKGAALDDRTLLA